MIKHVVVIHNSCKEINCNYPRGENNAILQNGLWCEYMRKLKMIFSKRTLIIVGITYIILALAFLHGYTTYIGGGGGFLNIGSQGLSGFFTAVSIIPFVLLGCIIYIIIKKQNTIYVIIGYLILTVGIASIGVGYSMVRYRLRQNERIQQWQEDIDFIQNTLGDDVRKIYPYADFYTAFRGWDDVEINLRGYRYEEQPNFDEEIANWREIAQSSSFVNFPRHITVLYYFENTIHPFASIRLNTFDLRFKWAGMSEEGISYLTPILINYLNNYHADFRISPNSTRSFNVEINGVLGTGDETAEEEMWQNFVTLYNINTELVEIWAWYRVESSSNSLSYNVRENRWSGSQ